MDPPPDVKMESGMVFVLELMAKSFSLEKSGVFDGVTLCGEGPAVGIDGAAPMGRDVAEGRRP